MSNVVTHPELALVFRLATGEFYQQGLNDANRSLRKLSPLARAVLSVAGAGRYDKDRDMRNRIIGTEHLLNLILTRGGVYPRDVVFYDVDLSSHNREGFQYSLKITSEMVGIEGNKEIDLSITSKGVVLRKGKERIVEAQMDGIHVIHMTDGEGVFLRPAPEYVQISGVGRPYIGIWYPELTNTPVSYTSPTGRIVWNTTY